MNASLPNLLISHSPREKQQKRGDKRQKQPQAPVTQLLEGEVKAFGVRELS